MGFYRLFLATLVVLSHVGIMLGSYHLGIAAVVSFFMISGYVMAGMIGRDFAGPERIGAFYADRALRLYPQYLFYLSLALVAIVLLEPGVPFNQHISLRNVLMNLAVFPLSLPWLMPDSLFLPQAWSLGLEAFFYLFIPWIVIHRLVTPMMLFSLAFFAMACAGIIDAEMFTYRLIPGTLFIFLVGAAMHEDRHTRLPLRALGVWLFVLATFIVTRLSPGYDQPFAGDVMLGLIVAVPMVWLLRNAPSSAADRIAGHLSYGVFLSHFMVIWAMIALERDPFGLMDIGMLVAASYALAAISWLLVERPVHARRKGMRDILRRGLTAPG